MMPTRTISICCLSKCLSGKNNDTAGRILHNFDDQTKDFAIPTEFEHLLYVLMLYLNSVQRFALECTDNNKNDYKLQMTTHERQNFDSLRTNPTICTHIYSGRYLHWNVGFGLCLMLFKYKYYAVYFIFIYDVYVLCINILKIYICI